MTDADEVGAPSADWLASSRAYRRRARKRGRRINKLLAACAAGDRPDLRLKASALMAEDIRDQLRNRRGLPGGPMADDLDEEES